MTTQKISTYAIIQQRCGNGGDDCNSPPDPVPVADEEPILSLKIILRIENSIYPTVLNRFFYTVLTLGNGSLNPSFVVLV